MATKKTKSISAEEFDRKFDAGENMSDHIDWDNAIKKVNVDFPVWMVKKLDEEAKRLAVSRQHVIKTIIDRHFQRDAVFNMNDMITLTQDTNGNISEVINKKVKKAK